MSKPVFNNKDHSFFEAVKKEADNYFAANQLKKTGNASLYLKAFLFISLAVSIYVFLLLGSYGGMTGILLCVVFALSLAGIALNVMHDACHGSFSSRQWVNNIMGLTMNALGSNAFLWKIKHNIVHHTYTNIDGVDNDIAFWPMLRQTPMQKWLPVHRYQYLYMYLLYTVATLHWMLVFDFEKYFTRKFTVTPIRKISFKEHFLFWFSKIMYVVFYIILPIILLGWQNWLIGFLLVHGVMGLVVTIIFQLAHLVEKAHIESGEPGTIIESEWAVHELKTTANFAGENKLITWYVGGLNYQVEHHLFPQVSHVHYPALSKLVKKQCGIFNLPYNSYPGMFDAILSHTRLMRDLGKKPIQIKELINVQ